MWIFRWQTDYRPREPGRVVSLRIGIDLMGSDSSPSVLYEAVQELKNDTCELVVFATPDITREGVSVTEVISMEDDPLAAIRLKKDSSLAVGLRYLKEKKIDAFISCGNTGALVAGSTLLLPLLPGVERPALLAVFPTQKKSLVVIDVGGNLSNKADLLVQFAHMGAAYQRCSEGIENPIIGLLNIGSESKKGTPEVREAYEILQKQKIQFAGNIEAREIFQGKIDVLVTDGFTGNVLLKTCEGLASFIFESHPNEALQKTFSYDEYPGAIVCGVDGLVIKCHGQATKKALKNSILGAINLLKRNLITQLKSSLLIPPQRH